MTQRLSILLAALVAGAALTVHLCDSPGSSREDPGTLSTGHPNLAEIPVTASDAGPPFDGWCAFSVALGRRHRPRDGTVLEHDGLTYHLCGAGASTDCDATTMWKDCGELLRADADRQWQLSAKR